MKKLFIGVREYIKEVIKFYLSKPEQIFPVMDISDVIEGYGIDGVVGGGIRGFDTLYIFIPFIRPIGKPNNYVIRGKGFYKNNTVSKYEKHLHKLITFNFNILSILSKLCSIRLISNLALLRDLKDSYQYIPISIEAIFNFTDRKVRDIDNLLKALFDILQLNFPIEINTFTSNSFNNGSDILMSDNNIDNKPCYKLHTIDNIVNSITMEIGKSVKNIRIISRDKFMNVKVYGLDNSVGKIAGIERINMSIDLKDEKGIQIIKDDSYLGFITGIKTFRYVKKNENFGQIGKLKLLDNNKYVEYYYPFLAIRITYISK